MHLQYWLKAINFPCFLHKKHNQIALYCTTEYIQIMFPERTNIFIKSTLGHWSKLGAISRYCPKKFLKISKNDS